MKPFEEVMCIYQKALQKSPTVKLHVGAHTSLCPLTLAWPHGVAELSRTDTEGRCSGAIRCSAECWVGVTYAWHVCV